MPTKLKDILKCWDNDLPLIVRTEYPDGYSETYFSKAELAWIHKNLINSNVTKMGFNGDFRITVEA